jgi:hypothetical protein
MAEREFITYDGVKFRKYKGEEIGSTGHYKIEVDKIENVTVSGTYLDSQANMAKFKQDFWDFAKVNSSTLGYNYLLIGKDYLKTFHRFARETDTNPPVEVDNLFDEFIIILKDLGLVNAEPVIEQGKKYKRMKIEMTTKNPPYKTFYLYFIPIDTNSIAFSNTKM